MSTIEVRASSSTDTWVQVSPSTIPSGRTSHAMTYDAARQQVVLFGGDNGTLLSNKLNDTWTLSGGSWTQAFPSTSPSPRRNAMMACDPLTKTDILFGGTTASGDVGETWSWNGTTWSRLFPTTSPAARDSGFMAYDQAMNEVVLFGGNTGLGSVTDTWTWNGTAWTQQAGGPAVPPNATPGAMTYDEATHQIVYVEGSNQETWLWGPQPGYPNGEWISAGFTPLTTSTSLIALAYDPLTQTVLLFGGALYPGFYGTATNATWSWNGTTWTQLSPAASPSARVQAVMVTDDSASAVELFGGEDVTGSLPNDTWMWNVPTIIDDASSSSAPDPIVKNPPPAGGKCGIYANATDEGSGAGELGFTGAGACNRTGWPGSAPNIQVTYLQLRDNQQNGVYPTGQPGQPSNSGSSDRRDTPQFWYNTYTLIAKSQTYDTYYIVHAEVTFTLTNGQVWSCTASPATRTG